jgi:hypothetical protein
VQDFRQRFVSAADIAPLGLPQTSYLSRETLPNSQSTLRSFLLLLPELCLESVDTIDSPQNCNMAFQKWRYTPENSPWSYRTLWWLWSIQINYLTGMVIHAIVFMALPAPKSKDLRRDSFYEDHKSTFRLYVLCSSKSYPYLSQSC